MRRAPRWTPCAATARASSRTTTRATLFDRLREEQARSGAAFVHPFDDPAGLAGAGTVGLELIEQSPDLDVVVVPIAVAGSWRAWRAR